MYDVSKLDELRAPASTDLLIVERDGKPYKIALGDLFRVLGSLEAKAVVAAADTVVIYDSAAGTAKRATLSALAEIPTTTTTAAPTTTTAAPTTTTTAAPTTTTTGA